MRPTEDTTTKKRSRFFAVVAVGLVALGWIFFAPTKLGGSVDYVVTDGNSMEPLLQDGDLAIIRHSDDYRVGDVAAYNSPQMGRVVLHRIKAADNGVFVFKGDNNSWIDPERLQAPDMAGKMVWHVPSVGGLLGKLGSPVPAAIVALGVMSVIGMVTQRRRRDDDEPDLEVIPRDSFFSSETLVELARPALTVAGVALLLFAGLGFTAFSRDTTVDSTASVGYEHKGRFGYRAPTENSLTSGGAAMGDGTPVFMKLSDQLNVDFSYSLDSDAAPQVDGKMRLVAKLQSDTGWSKTIATTPWNEITAGRGKVAQNVDLDWVQQAVGKVRQETGVIIGTYRLTFGPEVHVSGTVGGGPLTDRFSPELSFQVDETQLIPLGASVDQPLAALKPVEAGSVATTVTEPAAITLLRFEIPVVAARTIAFFGGLLALMALGFFGWIYRSALRGEESSRIAALYGDMVVEIKPGQVSGALDVDSFEALVHMATAQETMILHCKEDDCDSYFVIDQQAFRFRISKTEEAPEPQPEPLAGLLPRLRSVVFVEELEEARSA